MGRMAWNFYVWESRRKSGYFDLRHRDSGVYFMLRTIRFFKYNTNTWLFCCVNVVEFKTREALRAEVKH